MSKCLAGKPNAANQKHSGVTDYQAGPIPTYVSGKIGYGANGNHGSFLPGVTGDTGLKKICSRKKINGPSRPFHYPDGGEHQATYWNVSPLMITVPVGHNAERLVPDQGLSQV